MPTPDLTPEFANIRDEVTITRSGSSERWKRFEFYLGKYGPFVEKFPLETFTEQQVTLRIQALQQQLRNLHT